MSEAIVELFDKHVKVQRGSTSTVDVLLNGLSDADAKVVVGYLKRSKDEFGHAAAARALTELAKELPDLYLGPRRINGGTIAHWRSRN